MITRRGILKLLGLGGAAAVVAPEVARAALPAVGGEETLSTGSRATLWLETDDSWEDDVEFDLKPAPVVIDPSTYPRVRVTPFVQFGGRSWHEYRLARPELLRDLLGSPIFLGADGLARISANPEAATLVGVCDEVLTCEHDGREHIVRRWAVEDMPREFFGTVESIEPDGYAWVRIGGGPKR